MKCIPLFADDSKFAALLAELKRWEGTPFASNQARVGAGTDCARFVEGVLHNIGAIPPVRFPYYTNRGGGEKTLVTLIETFDSVQEMVRVWSWLECEGPPVVMRGDVLVSSAGRRSWHLFIAAELPTVWHCYDKVKTGSLFDPALEQNLKAVYRVASP